MAGELAKDIEPKTRADAPKVAAEARVEEVQPPESAMKAAPEGLSNTSGLKLSSLVKDYYEIALQSQQAKEAAKDPKDKAAADKEQKKEDPKETLKKIEQEIAEGTLGPNSLKAAKIISDWFVEQLIPNVISQLKQQGVPIPGQGPFNVPESLRQDSQGGESFLNSLASGAIKSDFLTAGRSKEESDRLDNTFVGRLSSGFDWLSRADRAAGEMQRAKQEQFLTDEITKLFTDSKGNVSEPEKLKAWLDKDSIAGGDWGRVAKERVELFKSVKEYVYAQYQLHESNPKTPFEPPPGIIIKKRADGEIDIDFDKTKDLLPARPEAKEQAESWQKWLKEWTPKIDSARSEYVNALQDSKENQGTKYILSFQELPFQDSVVRLNDKGEVQKILKASEAQAGDKPFNLADTDMTIRRVVGEDGKETIYVKPQLQLRETKIYNYLDLGAAAVGKPMDLPEREFKPKDFVAVNDGGKPKLIQAQDLENWLTWQKVFHRGEKVVMAAMDATMVVSGTIEFGAALKAGTEAASHIGWGLYHASLGATGVINNAYFKESEAGRIANQVRGTLFLVGGGVDLAKWGLGGVYRGAYRMMGGAAEEASLSQATIAMQKQLENTSWAVLSDHAGRVGSWAGVAFVPLAYEGAARSVHDLMDAINGTPDYMGQAIKDLKDKKIFLKSPDSGAGQEKKLGPTEELQKLRTQISGDSSNAASSILAKAIELSKNPDKKDEIEKFKSELINYFKPDKDKIVSLGIDRKLADERAGGYWKYRAGQDRQAQVAAAMALIQLSRTPDGNLPTVLAQRELQIPAYNQHQASSSRTYSLVKPEVEKQSVSLTDIATALRANLNDNDF